MPSAAPIGVNITLPADYVGFCQRRVNALKRLGFPDVTVEEVVLALVGLAVEDERLFDPDNPTVPLSIAQREIALERTNARAAQYYPTKIEGRIARTRQPKLPPRTT